MKIHTEIKKLTFLLFLHSLLFSAKCFSQHQGYFAAFVGGGIPTGHYGNTDISDSAAGFAKFGINFQLSAAYKLSKNFGICALVRTQSNALDVDSEVKQFAKKYPAIKWTMQAENWNVKSFLTGLYASYPTKDSSLAIDFKVMLGLASTALPALTITGTQNGNTITANQPSVSSGAICFAFGMGIQKNITESFCLLLGFDYMSTKPHFSDVTINYSNGTSQKISGNQIITIMTLNAGIGFRL